MKRGVSRYPQLNGLSGRAYNVAFHALRREQNRSLGLTGKGTPRLRSSRNSYPDLAALPPRQRAVARCQRLRDSRRMRFAEFAEQLARTIARAFVFVPPELREEFLQVGRQLTAIRRHIGHRKVKVR